MNPINFAQKYLRSIRNPRKWQYAKELTCWYVAGRIYGEPRPVQLSYMAAQAVRMRLADIFGE